MPYPSEQAEKFEDIRRELECPVCLEVPKSGPIYQCNFGHTICKVKVLIFLFGGKYSRDLNSEHLNSEFI